MVCCYVYQVSPSAVAGGPTDHRSLQIPPLRSEEARPFPTLRGHRPPRRRVEGLRCVGMGRIPALDTRDRPPLTPTAQTRDGVAPTHRRNARHLVRSVPRVVRPGPQPSRFAPDAARTIPARSPEVPGGRRRSVKAPLHERGFQLDFMEQAWPGRPGVWPQRWPPGSPVDGKRARGRGLVPDCGGEDNRR